MYLADVHTHSRFSPDARDSITDMAQSALQKGLSQLCITDHVDPLVWQTTQRRTEPFDWEFLRRELAQAQEAFGEQIALRVGMELGDVTYDPQQTAQLLQGAPEFDFIIGSVHRLSQEMGGGDLYFFHPKSEEEAYAGIRDYLKQVRALAEWDGEFSVLGHLTIPVRYLNEGRGFHISFDDFGEEIEAIFRRLLEKGRGIEVNTNRGNTPLPDEKWLRLYRSLGGEIITLGSDAHRAEHVGSGIQEGQALLRRCGFTKFCTFEKMKPVWHKL